MAIDDGSRSRRYLSGVFAAGFTIALIVLRAAQLALMSILDAQRAERAAEQISTSRFTENLVEQAVTETIGGVVDPAVVSQVTAAVGVDPAVQRIVEISLIDAYRQVVDADPPAPATLGAAVGNEAVGTAISRALSEAGELSGIDLTPLSGQITAPAVLPDDLPRLGLRTVAERSRLISALLAVIFAAAAIALHPRPGRALRGLGWKAAVACGAWIAAMLIVGWVIGLTARTLFGEMLQDIWTEAVPSMLLLVTAGAVLGVGLFFAGLAVDGAMGDVGGHHDRDSRFVGDDRY
jgi:hypothetical protein